MTSLLLLFLGTIAFSQEIRGRPPYRADDLCSEIVTTLYPQWTAKIPPQKLRRVEIRNCRVQNWGFLQIAAWGEDASSPSLVVDTRRTTIVKAAMVRDVFVLETAGASSNVVQVVVYHNGTPRLVLDDSIKAYAHIEMSWKKVVVGLPQEKGPERVYEFPTGTN
jgi:hypothetical protein